MSIRILDSFEYRCVFWAYSRCREYGRQLYICFLTTFLLQTYQCPCITINPPNDVLMLDSPRCETCPSITQSQKERAGSETPSRKRCPDKIHNCSQAGYLHCQEYDKDPRGHRVRGRTMRYCCYRCYESRLCQGSCSSLS